jgi:hypothetical protein
MVLQNLASIAVNYGRGIKVPSQEWTGPHTVTQAYMNGPFLCLVWKRML